jgi:hypothetical protein
LHIAAAAIIGLGLIVVPVCGLAQNYFESAPGPQPETAVPLAVHHHVARPRSSAAGRVYAPASATTVRPPQAAHCPRRPPAWLVQRGPLHAEEAADFGVAPQKVLHQGPPHAPTPLSVPGATTITTMQLYAALQQRQPMVLLYVNEGGGAIAGSHWLYGAGRGVDFNDVVEGRLAQKLTALTRATPASRSSCTAMIPTVSGVLTPLR